MIYLLLIIIAVGVLLISEPGKAILAFLLVWGVRIFIFILVATAILVSYFYFHNKNEKANLTSNQSSLDITQKPETSDNPFPMNNGDTQYGWYDQHDVAMAYRCYPGGGCTAQDWAYAVYANKNDSRGATLKQKADIAQASYISQFPVEKCVTESGVKICDLSHSVKKTYGDGTREVNFEANAIDCVNIATGQSTQNQGNTVTVGGSDMYCASDYGSVYIDPTIKVAKYFNKISRDNYSSPFYVPSNYATCIWTYADGNGAIPYIEVSSNVGPSSGFNVEAFCKNGSNQVDIYSYKDN